MTQGLLDDAEAGALDTPAVVVDLDRMDARIASMARLMRERGIALRPHAKTHKSIEVARRQIDGRRRRPDGRHDRRGRGVRRRRLHGPVHRLPGDGVGPKADRLRRLAGRLRALGRGGLDRRARGAGGGLGVRLPPLRVLIEIDTWRGADRRPARCWRVARSARQRPVASRWSGRSPTRATATGARTCGRRPVRTRSAAWLSAAASLRAEGIEPTV